MSRPFNRLVVLVVTVAVLGAGCGYTLTRHVSYESTASVVLVPSASNAADLAAATDSFSASGTAGTFVELLAAPDTVRAAHAPIDVTVRAVPDSRVIDVTAHGSRIQVQPGLGSLLAAASVRQSSLRALWTMSVLAQPSGPSAAGASTAMLLLAAVLLALLAGLVANVLLRRATRTGDLAGVEPIVQAGGVDSAERAPAVSLRG
jgi:hypothetical protein